MYAQFLLLGPLLAFASLTAVPLWGAAESAVVDQVIRYVGKDVVTRGDLMERVNADIFARQRAGQRTPLSRSDYEAFLAATIEQITEEILLIQESNRLEVVVDDRPIRREIREIARLNRQPATLEAVKQALSDRIKQQQIASVLQFYTQTSKSVTPGEIAAAYADRRDQFVRPARQRLLRILVRASGQREREDINEGLLSVFRRAQTDAMPAVSAVVTAEDRQAYIASRKDPAAQTAILADVAERVVVAAKASENPQTQRLAKDAQEVLGRLSGLMTLEEAEAGLRAVAQAVAAEGDAAAKVELFKEYARQMSNGPRASDGGDLGLVELSALGEPYASEARGLSLGEMTAIFPAGQARCLMLLAEQEQESVRDLAQVSAEIRSQLEDESVDLARQNLIARLRERTVIQDLQPLTEIDIQAGVLENAEALAEETPIEEGFVGDPTEVLFE